ncbi:MAG: sulfurtransferase [Acetobacteraceae bacterium]|nr:sulfurtransferase [Acetobacteraceae bacterium]MSP29568.1 sulfurtransferase [Acetobacteraceae bacterium]
MKPLMSTECLADELKKSPDGPTDLMVFDATKYLPNENRDGQAEFLATHITGARYFDIDLFSDQDSDLPHMIPTVGRFEKLTSALGISNNTRVIFYDQKGIASSARGWWLMGLFGHDNAAVLDGGLPKWRLEGRAVESGAPLAAPATHYTAAFRPQRLRGVGDLLGNLATQTELVLDARAAGRFTGAQKEIRPGVRSGHIPGSANLPYNELLSADGTFLAPDALRARFAQAGVDGKKLVVTTCGSGITACILTMGMQLADLPAAAVYDGSWTEWGSRKDTPVESQ